MNPRLVLLGTGAMADYQCAKFTALGVEVVGCYDADRARAEGFARSHGLSAFFDDGDPLLDLGADAVSCCLVDSLHLPFGQRVLDRGLPLFVEKPLADTLPRARELAARACRPAALAQVNLSKRNAPALEALRAVVNDGTLGRLEFVDASYRQGWVLTKVWGDWEVVPRWKWRLQNEFCTAGVLGDLGVHLMDAVVHVLGVPDQGEVVRALDLTSARRAGLVPPGSTPAVDPGRRSAFVDVEARLAFAGVPCRFGLSWIDPKALDGFRIRVEGRQGTAVLDLEGSRSSVTVIRGGRESVVEGPPTASTYQRFVDAVRSGRALDTSVADALVAQESLERLFTRGAA